MPRTFDPRINELDNVYLYDIDDLEGVVADNRDERAREAAKAETIVEAEVDAFWRWLASLDVVPTIVALREKLEAIRRAELRADARRARRSSTRAQREAVERAHDGDRQQDPARAAHALRRHQADAQRGVLRRGGAPALPARRRADDDERGLA